MVLVQITKKQIDRALEDIWGGFNAWRLWTLFGLNDIKARYRRSTLGPFWVSLTAGAQTVVTAFVMTYLVHGTLDRYLPYICLGMIMWNSFTAIVNEGAMAFISSAELILQIKRPLSIYLLQVLWRNTIIGAHTIIVFFVIAFLLRLFPGPTYILAIPGLFLFLANAAWVGGVAGILSTRFRDVPMIVLNAFTMLFWLTPVLYEMRQLSGAMALTISLNPLYHIFEIFRAPLLLEQPTVVNWLVALSTALVGWLVLLVLFARTRERIPYWL